MLLVRALAGGFDIDIHEPSLNPLISISRDHRYTLISLIPAQMYTILKDEESLLKLNKFKNILLGGAHISDELATMLGKVKPKVYHTYGMTETCSLIALRLMNHDPWPGFRMNDYISSELSEECCLSVKGEQTGNQWVHTRDVIEFLSDGSFLIKGRLDTSINTGGHKIFPEILEPRILEILKQNSIEVNLAITSIPDPIWGEQLVLVTEPLNGIENPLEILNNKLKPFELPRAFLIIEKLPLNQSLKTDRAELKNLVLMEKNLKLL